MKFKNIELNVVRGLGVGEGSHSHPSTMHLTPAAQRCPYIYRALAFSLDLHSSRAYTESYIIGPFGVSLNSDRYHRQSSIAHFCFHHLIEKIC